MTVVNDWLSRNPQYRVIRCESIERKVNKDGSVETETMIHFQGSGGKTNFVRGIR